MRNSPERAETDGPGPEDDPGRPRTSADGRRIAVYYAWSRPGETGAPLGTIENRFPALFESRRMLYPRYLELADTARYDQGIAGFIDHVLRSNFAGFVSRAAAASGRPVTEFERVDDAGVVTPVSRVLADDVDTLVIISFDTVRTAQTVTAEEAAAVAAFLDVPGRLLFVAPHHDIGDAPEGEFRHHGDRTIPPEQRFGGFARSLLGALGVPVENRFGLRPSAEPDGSPSPVLVNRQEDRLGLLDGVLTFNLHAHLPHLERRGDAVRDLSVLARQRLDPAVPPHPFMRNAGGTFDALLQSRAGVFAGDLVVGDATLFSSTAGGLPSLERLWSNILTRVAPDPAPRRGS
ncbi:hypothetical protein [Dactylosporangium sp. CA-092794]|uniref:hypothetical protein n=1 Tax=Dactylosporangium sp. CA-092794 TaxID=3239929 RepID=UPI003D8B42A4